MSEFSFGSDDRARVRASLAALASEIGSLSVEGDHDGTAKTRLDGKLADLVRELALGPTPDLATCKHCGHQGMRAATLCGNCWAKLTPPGHEAPSE